MEGFTRAIQPDVNILKVRYSKKKYAQFCSIVTQKKLIYFLILPLHKEIHDEFSLSFQMNHRGFLISWLIWLFFLKYIADV